MATTKYSIYHAECWAENKSIAELQEEIKHVKHKAETHHYQWNEVGNTTADWARHGRLVEILTVVEKSKMSYQTNC